MSFEQIGYLPTVSYPTFRTLVYQAYDEIHGKEKRRKSYEKEREKAIRSAVYSLSDLQKIMAQGECSEELSVAIANKYHEGIQTYLTAKEKFYQIDWNLTSIKQSKEKESIKEVLDALQQIKRMYQLFMNVAEENQPDPVFYEWLQTNQSFVDRTFDKLYNQVRNYLTKKTYSNEKIKLNFQNPTLVKGWDKNKELDNSAFIVRQWNQQRQSYDYFLGIWHMNKPKKERKTRLSSEGTYEKMHYKLFPDPSKMLPKLFHAKKWLEKYPVTDEYLIKYKKGCHKKGVSFEREFLHEVIDHFKLGLQEHDEQYQAVFQFPLKETQEYTSYAEFIQDVEKDNYQVHFEIIADVMPLVAEEKLFLFQIWSKDFSIYSKGRKNLHTIYFESLFSDDNLKQAVFKLSGEAEVFYRPSSIAYSDKKRREGHHYEELKHHFTYPILKDRRYSQDKFLFHVPIALNYHADNLKPKQLNERVQQHISDFTHIIGIDRGKRHLVYLSVISIKTGENVEQKHLDEIINLDPHFKEHKTSYLQKLTERSQERDKQRKTWESIETIKELKEGYISQLVNEICRLQAKYHALIIFENLNQGFKNSRIKIEKQIYQKFEIALIKKFNYLIDKSDAATYRKGLQLTNPITTLEKIGNQTGIIFYIPAWNTSKIDPVTGFVNLFYADDLKYKNVQQVQEFMKKIDRIYFSEDVFKFEVDFSKWNNRYPNTRKKWLLTSYGERIYSFKNPQKNNQWDYQIIELTSQWQEIMNEDGTLKQIDAKTCREFMKLFKLMLNLRHSIPGTEIDYLILPVQNQAGIHFDSRQQFEHHLIFYRKK